MKHAIALLLCLALSATCIADDSDIDAQFVGPVPVNPNGTPSGTGFDWGPAPPRYPIVVVDPPEDDWEEPAWWLWYWWWITGELYD